MGKSAVVTGFFPARIGGRMNGRGAPPAVRLFIHGAVRAWTGAVAHG